MEVLALVLFAAVAWSVWLALKMQSTADSKKRGVSRQTILEGFDKITPADTSQLEETIGFARPNSAQSPLSLADNDDSKRFVFDEYDYDWVEPSPNQRWRACYSETGRYGDPIQPRLILVDVQNGAIVYSKKVKGYPDIIAVTNDGVILWSLEEDASRKHSVLVAYDSNGKLLWSRNFNGAIDVTVTNDGVILWSLEEDASREHSVLVAYDSSGNLLWSRKFNCSVYLEALSQDERLACVSKSGESEGVMLLSLADGQIVWERDGVERGRFVFEGNELFVELNEKPLGKLRFLVSESGEISREFFDAIETYNIWRYGRPHVMFRTIMEAMGEEPPDVIRAQRALESLESHEDMTGDAQFLRLKGEVALAAGREAEALACWEKALSLNPKIRIKTKTNALRRKLARAERELIKKASKQ